MRIETHPTTPTTGSIPRTFDPAHAPANRIPKKWRWHFDALQRLRDHLVDDLAIKLSTVRGRDESPLVNPMDSASEESDRILAVNLLSGEQNALRELEFAMQRILSGTYGVCEKSGKRIETERLRAIPWTRFSRNAQDALEEQEKREKEASARF